MNDGRFLGSLSRKSLRVLVSLFYSMDYVLGVF